MPIVIIAQGKVTLGVGANINGAIFDGEKLVAPDGYTVEHVQWIDFIFEGINISAFTFLSNSLIGVTNIINNIRKLLQYK